MTKNNFANKNRGNLMKLCRQFVRSRYNIGETLCICREKLLNLEIVQANDSKFAQFRWKRLFGRGDTWCKVMAVMT